MKKLFSFFSAVLMSTSLFSTPASVPTVADVTSAGFDVTYARVIVLYFDEQVCNDIVWAGSYNEWNTSPEDMLTFEPLEGFAGWYVLELFDSSNPCQGKPVQLKKDGSFSWDFQTGDPDAWINMAQPGTQMASIESGYSGESDITLFNLGVYIYEVAYFKFHNTPCGVDLVVTAPTFTPEESEFEGSVEVTLACETEGAEIYFTVNGSTPDNETGIYYEGPFTLTATTTVKAVAYKDGKDSEITEKTYTKSSSTDINVINAEDVPNGAIIKDDKVYIIRDGKVYNLQGSEIKNADEILKSVNF